MASEREVKSMVEQCKGSGKTFAEFIAELFKDRFLEIYVGDSYEELSTDQVSVSYPAVFCGKVVAAYRECLVVNSVFVDKGKHMKLGNLIFISERSIRALTEIDGNGIIEDMMLRSKESLDIKKNFIDGQLLPPKSPKDK
jgi:hypothetical protein